MLKAIVLLISACSLIDSAWSADFEEPADTPESYKTPQLQQIEENEAPGQLGLETEPSLERSPAGLGVGKVRKYPGGADEDDLRVQTKLPDAQLKMDTRGIQREVFKALYNQDLKDERQDSIEE